MIAQSHAQTEGEGIRGRIAVLHLRLATLYWLLRKVNPLIVNLNGSASSRRAVRNLTTGSHSLRRSLKQLRRMRRVVHAKDTSKPGTSGHSLVIGNPVSIDLIALLLVLIDIAVGALVLWLFKLEVEAAKQFHEVITRINVPERTAAPTLSPEPWQQVDPVEAAMRAERVRALSRANYTRPRAVVEAEISRFLSGEDHGAPTLTEIATRADAALAMFSIDGQDARASGSSIVELLTSLGMDQREAEELVQAHPPQRILRQLKWLPARQPRNAVALLRKAIVEDFPSPPDHQRRQESKPVGQAGPSHVMSPAPVDEPPF